MQPEFLGQPEEKPVDPEKEKEDGPASYREFFQKKSIHPSTTDAPHATVRER